MKDKIQTAYITGIAITCTAVMFGIIIIHEAFNSFSKDK